MATQQPQQPNASLYVGDLPAEITEAMLFDLFKAVGPVLSIRVCRDAVTRRSLSYAYVNFQNPVDAERALETLNYHQIKGSPIRIMWSHRDPSLRKTGSGNIFIKNLHKSIDNQTLYDTFSQFGNILSCKVATDPNGESRGYGFVHFESEESAKAAIEKVNGMLLKSMQVFVGPFVRRALRIQEHAGSYTNVYIKQVKTGITEEEISGFFGKIGPIESHVLKHDRKDRPFAFVDFKNHDDAVKAVTEFHDKEIEGITEEGQKIYIGRAQKKGERLEEQRKRVSQLRARKMHEYSGSNLYVKNLDDNVDDAGLKAAFEKFGEITSAKVMMDDVNPGLSKGFGFVCFKDAESANKAISEMNGHLLGVKPLYVNVAQRKEVRRATLEVQYAARMTRMPGPSVPSAGGQPGMGYPPMYPPTPGYSAFPPSGSYFYPPGPAAPQRAAMTQAPKWAQQQQGIPGMPFPGQMSLQQAQMPMRPPPQQQAGLARRVMPGQGRAPAPPQMGRGPLAGKGLPRGIPPQARPLAPPSALPPPGLRGPGVDDTLSAAALLDMAPDQQKNALGERLFARISTSQPEYAAKITGMLLEMDVTECLNLLESPEVLDSKIAEALAVLQAHDSPDQD
uniref:Polyadenylate-binding protein n=1 Tax=Euglena gracilis TaxID=3039 RepID=A0AA51UB21_EUGGR|nr:polyadenylate-binding protein 1t [Euglena gracilis]BDX17157.1 polyadenylate-binding protein 1A [Euglena gracilis]